MAQALASGTPETQKAYAAWLVDREDHGMHVATAANTFDADGSGPLCVRCIGRLASRIVKGVPLEDVGAAVIQHADLTCRPADDPDCPWCEGLVSECEVTATRVAAASVPYEFDTFVVGHKLVPDILRAEATAFAELGPYAEHAESLKSELNRIVGGIVAPEIDKEVAFQNADLLILVDPYFDQIHATPAHVYIEGRYCKFDRRIPQTRWPCRKCQGIGCLVCDGSGQQYEHSVESLIAPIPMRAFQSADESFHGMGREDIDAVMLGTGRPFVLELKEPRFRRARPLDTPRLDDPAVDDPTQLDPSTLPELALTELANLINAEADGRVVVTNLRYVPKQRVAELKESARDKTYRAHIITEEPVARAQIEAAITEITSTPIEQDTPDRVSHRRAQKTRTRSVRDVDIIAWGEHARDAREVQIIAEESRFETPTPITRDDDGATTHFTLEITAESGTYIKELVHSDEGRTRPSFAGHAEIPMRVFALDVVGVQDED